MPGFSVDKRKLLVTVAVGLGAGSLSFSISGDFLFQVWGIAALWMILFPLSDRLGLLTGYWTTLYLYVFTGWVSILSLPNLSQGEFLYLFAWALWVGVVIEFSRMALQKTPSWVRFIAGFVLVFLALLLPISFGAHFLTFSGKMGDEQFKAFLQSGLGESQEFIESFLPWYGYLWFILHLGLIVVLSIRIAMGSGLASKISGSTLSLAVLFLGISFFNPWSKVGMNGLALTATQSYVKDVKDLRSKLRERKSGLDLPVVKKKNEGELFIFVIGESQSKNHMGMYGYHRNTTPHLSKIFSDSLAIRFDNVFSCHTHTIPVLTLALTQADQLDPNSYRKAFSILDLLEASNFDTYWISNQVKIGAWDNPISVLAQRADQQFNFNPYAGKSQKSRYYDEVLVEQFSKLVDKGIEKNTVVFIHLMGSHSKYENRFPLQFKKYKGPLRWHEFGDGNLNSYFINQYDNSVLYTDHVLNKLDSICKGLDLPWCMAYFSDHGEDVINGKGHNVGSFSFDMTPVPFFLSCSPLFFERYQERWKNLEKNRASFFVNDHLYDLYVGLLDLQTPHYSSKSDPGSSDYKSDPSQLKLIHGDKELTDPENRFYHQAENISWSKNLPQSPLILPHRVNTQGKMSQVIYDGFKGFEIDVFLHQKGEDYFFHVGHDPNRMSGYGLEQYFSSIDISGVQRVWIDVKNLNSDNVLHALNRLEVLDSLFGIKGKAIFESSMKGEAFARVSERGFHTSYYLPYGDYFKDQQNWPSYAKTFAQRIKAQKVKAVSFDVEYYPFVKTQLEALIPKDLDYHCWDLSLRLNSKDFKSNLQSKEYLKDARIKTLLVGYDSYFSL